MHITFTPHQLAIARSASAAALLVQNARPDQRPYLHPILAPDGQGVLTEDAPAHHPWQHGLYVGLNGVNGIGFWTEGLRGAPTDGTFHPHPLSEPMIDRNKVNWSVVTDWRAPDKSLLLTERQMWSFKDHGDYYLLKLEQGLHAAVDITFAQYAYGGLFLRMPYRKEMGGAALNSEGQANAAAEAQRARWVAVSMPLADRNESWAGMAIFDHTANREHPTPWRVDNQLGIGPSPCIAGAWQLRQGETAYTRYGVYIFTGPIDAPAVEAQWRQFCDL